jgi:hypothetical protein
MNRNKAAFSLLFFVMASLVVLQASCSGGNTAISTGELATTETGVALASPTRRPTITARPTQTASPTTTVTVNPTATFTPTLPPPPDDFSNIKFISFGPLPNWNFMFTFGFPSPVEGEYYVETRNPRKVFPCRPLLEYNHPERMVCLGRVPAVEKNIDFVIKDAHNDAVLYTGWISIPFEY